MLEAGFYNMDCMEAMKQFPDKFFDLAIVDPPYGISKGSGQRSLRLNHGCGKLRGRVLNQSDCVWDTEPPNKEYFDELIRVSKEQVIFGGNYFSLPPTRCILVWDKVQPWENFSQVEIAWTSFDKPSALFRYAATQAQRKEKQKKIHPTQKPIALYEWVLSKYAAKGMKILDTHVGSASSLIACYRAGLDAWGFEINPEYYQKANERLDSEKMQTTMFDLLGDK